MHLYKETYLTSRFFIYFGLCTLIMVVGFVWTPFIYVSFSLLVFGILAVITDLTILFSTKQPITSERKIVDILSLGDPNQVTLTIERKVAQIKSFKLIDELPEQLQVRDFLFQQTFVKTRAYCHYTITPKSRGIYSFGHIQLFIRSSLALVSRRVQCGSPKICKVFPSVIQLKKFEILSLSSASTVGSKNIRRIGHSYEFDQIKNYVFGDDSRSINWKASGRRGSLMFNQFEDERSQQIMSIVDNSRLMQIPFNGMSLLDHAINSTLVLSNIVLKKHDKMGLVTFAKKINTFLLPNNGTTQLHKIYHSLFNEKTSLFEANYEQLHYAVKTTLTNRSLLFLFTNFDTTESLKDVLPILRKLNKNHLLVVVFFDDNELKDAAQEKVNDVFGIYEQTIRKKLIHEKELISKELRKHGIQTFKTSAENLSMHTLQKYFELKSRGLI